jgi:hypothetical protein
VAAVRRRSSSFRSLIQSTWTCAEAVVGFVGGPNVWPLLSSELTSPLTCGDTWRSCFHTEQSWRHMGRHTRYFKTVVCAHRMQAILNTCSRLLMHVRFNTRYIWLCRILIHFSLKIRQLLTTVSLENLSLAVLWVHTCYIHVYIYIYLYLYNTYVTRGSSLYLSLYLSICVCVCARVLYRHTPSKAHRKWARQTESNESKEKVSGQN